MFENEKKILGIDKITLKDVKKSFKDKAKLYHPDISHNDSSRFILLKNAYDTLINYIKNKKKYKIIISYDQVLKRKEIIIDNIKIILNPNKIHSKKTNIKFDHNGITYQLEIFIEDKDVIFHKGCAYRKIE